MQINLTGHHVDITPPMREYVMGKFGRLERHFDRVTNVHVILSVEKQPVEALYFEQIPPLYKFLADFAPGSTVTVGYLRNGKAAEARLAVVEMEEYIADVMEVRQLGLTVRDITGPMALIRRYPTSDGVYITGMRPGRIIHPMFLIIWIVMPA